MEKRFSFHQTLFFNLSNVVLCAFITQLKVSFEKQILKDSSFQTTWRMFTDITISTQGLFQLDNQSSYIYFAPTMCQELYYMLEIH